VTVSQEKRVVTLNGNKFKLAGPMGVNLISAPPPRTSNGNDVVNAETILSSITYPDGANGIGLYKMESIDENRFSYFSLLRSGRGWTGLPERGVDMGAPSGLSGAGLEALWDHGTALYGVWNNKSYAWNDVTGAWPATGSFIKDFGEAPSDSVNYNYLGSEYVYVATGTTLWQIADSATVGTYTDLADPTDHIIVWDNKLIRESNGETWVSVDNGATWTTKGRIPTLASRITRLTLYYDASGDLVPYAAAKDGLYQLDYDNAEWIKTRMTIPAFTGAGRGAVEWRNDFFLSAGMDVAKYTVAPTATTTDVGLNRLYGLPAEMRGLIQNMQAGYNELYALLDSSLAVALSGTAYYSNGTYLGTAGFGITPRAPGLGGYQSVMAWNGVGWRVVWRSPSQTTSPRNVLFVSQSNDKYRLMWAAGAKSYYIDLSRTIRNPQQYPEGEFETGRELYEDKPWFNAFSLGRKDLAVVLVLRVRGLTGDGTNYVNVKYGLDLDDEVFYDLRHPISGSVDGTFEENGLYERVLDVNRVGRAFDYIRIRETLYTDDETASPYIEYIGWYYATIPLQKWGFTFTISIGDDGASEGTAKMQHETLHGLLPSRNPVTGVLSEPALVRMSYRDTTDTEHDLRVLVYRAVATEETGGDFRSTWQLSCVQVLP
jgi:hypothetical protein